MKSICAMCVAVIIGFIPQSAVAGNELIWEKQLPFQSATIHYTVSGVETGTETLYIRNYGKERAKYRETITKMMGIEVKDASIEFVTPEFITTYNLQTGDAVKGANPNKYLTEEFNKLSSADKKKALENAKKMGAAFAQGVGGKIEENVVKILGYDCDKVETQGGVEYYFHGTLIPLKTEINMMGMKLIIEATSISKGGVDEKYFSPPEGITAQFDPSEDSKTQMMSRQAITALVDPESVKSGPTPAGESRTMEDEMTVEDKAMIDRAGEMMKSLKNIFGK